MCELPLRVVVPASWAEEWGMGARAGDDERSWSEEAEKEDGAPDLRNDGPRREVCVSVCGQQGLRGLLLRRLIEWVCTAHDEEARKR